MKEKGKWTNVDKCGQSKNERNKTMTEQEAIERLKECLVCEIMDKEAGTSTDETVEALTMAADALKKQIPEQVNGNVDYYTCKCGAIVPPMEKYCQDCGQRLKWRGE